MAASGTGKRPQGTAPLLSEQLAAGARVLAAAFRDNPLNVAVIGADPDRRLRCNRAGMRQLLPVVQRHGLALGGGSERLSGVLIATPPHAYPLPAPPLGAQLRTLAIQGFGVRTRWGRVFEHLDRIHPLEPHWYLATLGVAPSEQSRGTGRSLLSALLCRSDRDEMPCYLETDRPENVAFYEPAGFVVERESRVLGVRVWHMRRKPQAA